MVVVVVGCWFLLVVVVVVAVVVVAVVLTGDLRHVSFHIVDMRAPKNNLYPCHSRRSVALSRPQGLNMHAHNGQGVDLRIRGHLHAENLCKIAKPP